MTQDEKRIKIAEAVGINIEEYRMEEGGINTSALPHYFNDLNDCHEMEEFIPSSLRLRYTLNLTDITDDFFWSKARATAAQRAEAFGKTLNLW